MHILINKNYLTYNKLKVRCAIGKKGIGYKRKEGDLITPKGRFKIKYILYRKDRVKFSTKMKKKVINSEKKSRIYARRSIVANNLIKKNKKISKKDLTFKRPGTGIEPFHLEKIIGKLAKKDIQKDTLIKFKDLI